MARHYGSFTEVTVAEIEQYLEVNQVVPATQVPTPAAGKINIFLDSADGIPKYKDSTGAINLFGASDHGSLSGLSDDDHAQYHTDARGDARYFTQAQLTSSLNGEGASLIGVEDAAGVFTATTLEAVLSEIQSNIDAAQSGITVKGAVDATTTADLPSSVYLQPGPDGDGSTLSSSVSASLPAQDGVTLSVGDRLLVKDQTDARQNGIYDVTDAGSAGSPWVLTRSEDMDGDAGSEVIGGICVLVDEGTLNGNSKWAVEGSASDSIALGTDNVVWTKFEAASALASQLSSAAPGDGASLVSIEDSAGLITATTVEGALAELATSVAASTSFKQDWINDDGSSITVTHNLGTLDVLIQIFDTADGETIGIDSSSRDSLNTVTLSASQAPGTTWRVLIQAL